MDRGIAFVTGRLSRDPQFFGEGDKRRAIFSVAYNRGRGDRRKSVFIDCIAWGKMANLLEHFSKGNGVSIDGELEMDTWEKDGQKRTRLQVNVRSISMTTPFGERPSGGEYGEASADAGVSIGGDDVADIGF
jgi:single-stranded DNA-binding protein